ncbi:MAG: efflux RND transporter permease subunit [Planctomycetes bacterium]|nr:efflux RND transporter permease subunit [Planctomycetota bacterium]
MFEKVKEMNDIPIKVDQGAPVFLRDVAEAQDSYQIQTNIVRLNGKRQVYVPVYRQPGANVIQVVNEVRNKSEQILQRLKEMDPRAKDLRLDVVMDQSISAKKTINGLKINVIFGALLAAISIGVFLANIRSTVIVLLLLPLGIFAAMAGLFFTGNTLNSMTIGGLMLTLGMLTDQAIVVLDNIIRHLRMGKTKMQAALDGAGEVAVPMFVAMLTTIIVFFPIVFLSGMARFLFAPLALSATFAVFGAYVMAMMVVPSYCAKFLHIHGSKHSRNDKTLTSVGGEERGMGKSGKYYESLLRATLKHKPVTLLGVFVLFLLSIFLFQRIGTELFPQIEAGQFMILVRAPSGTRVEESERLIQDIEKEIQGIIGQGDPDGMDDSSDLQMLISNIGVLMDWPAAYTPNTGPMDSFILIQLKEDTKKGAIQYSGILREHFRDRFPGIEFAFDTGGMLTAALNFGLPSPINIQIKGSLLETSYEIANAMVKEVKKVRGATDVRIAQRLDYPAIDIEVDRIKAAYLQITEEDVVKNIVTALNSSINFDPAFWIDNQNGNHYFVGAQYFEDDIVSLQTLENIPITSKKNSSPVLLKNIATFKRTTAPAVVNHHDITRVIDVYANVSGRDAGSVATEIEERIKRSPVIQDLMAKYGPKGYTYNIRGEIQSMRESFGQLGQGLLIAIILVYLLLVAQFRSFRSPLIIILTVPLGFIGVSIMLYTTGTSLNIQSFMGIITMIGLVVDYSALLVEFADKHQEEGMSIEEAIVQAARTRLRPILMTSSTAVIAVIPAAIVYGGGGGASVPLARAIIGGVVAAVVLCLFVIPPLYIYLARRRTVVTA